MAALADLCGADTVIVDSLKDAAVGLTEDEVGAAYNRARQLCLASGIEVLVLQPWADDVERDVHRVWSALARVARLRRELRLRCPDCGDVMRPQPVDWLLCDSGHHHEGAGAISRRLQARPSMTTAEVCQEFNITPERVWQWKRRRHIAPVEQGRGRGAVAVAAVGHLRHVEPAAAGLRRRRLTYQPWVDIDCQGTLD